MHLNHQPEMMAMMENEILLGDKIDYEKMKGAVVFEPTNYGSKNIINKKC